MKDLKLTVEDELCLLFELRDKHERKLRQVDERLRTLRSAYMKKHGLLVPPRMERLRDVVDIRHTRYQPRTDKEGAAVHRAG